MFDVSKIPGFRALVPKDYDESTKWGNTPPAEIDSFWDTTGNEKMSEVVYDIPHWFRICIHANTFLMNPGTLFELCQYLKIPYPVQEMKNFEKSEIRRFQKAGVCERRRRWWKELEHGSDSRIENLEKAIEDLVPTIFDASYSKLDTARLRAVWGALRWDLKMSRAFLAGLSFPKLFE